MSYRTLLEMNHDLGPDARDDDALLRWARQLAIYRGSGNPSDLPDGLIYKWTRHHSDPCPFDQPLEFESRYPRSRFHSSKRA
jgi:hypothetical protein